MAAGAGLLASLAPVVPARAGTRRRNVRTVDLTHRLVKDFPGFFGDQPVITDQVDNDFDTTGFYSKSWAFPEHIGTHVDSPGHFSQGGRLVDDLTTDELIAPLVVVDIRDKVMDNPNATVDADDLLAWERGHGRIPQGALVAMDSGWHDKVGDPDAFLGGDGFPDLNFPGFSVDATEWLVTHRDPVGIGVDSPSLDPGNSATFDVHFSFLGSDRYGIENLDNLTAAPAKGATVFVGAVPWEDGSGGPCRVIATR
jgi:kynurenine formamidase